MKKITINKIRLMKSSGKKIAVLTCYDYEMSRVLSDAGVDILLVGDSLGMVKLGYESTVPVSVDEMIHHAKAVKKANPKSFIVVDVPFSAKNVADVVRLYKNSKADAVKIEVFHKSSKNSLKLMEDCISKGIPVMGHVGLTPQYVEEMGGYKVQGRDEFSGIEILSISKKIESFGVFSIVLECIPASLAKNITEALKIPTIGIGAGIYCDGQVLVLDDMLGITQNNFKFVKKYAELRNVIAGAVKKYCADVRNNKFPAKENSFQ